jgi:membrane protease YdiL (CAAX protease family)
VRRDTAVTGSCERAGYQGAAPGGPWDDTGRPRVNANTLGGPEQKRPGRLRGFVLTRTMGEPSTDGLRESQHMSLVDAAISAFLQVAVLGGVPFLGYFVYQRRRYKRMFREIASRAGLQRGEPRFFVYSLAFAVVGVIVLIIWSPPLEPLTRQGSAQRQFVGLGFGVPAVTLAFLNGAVQTAFAEELLFRGLIAGSLSRRLALGWANLAQASIFFLPHLAILLFAPELWGILPVVFAGALLVGWVRIKSGSILGPWLMHASGNVTMALMVAIRTTV